MNRVPVLRNTRHAQLYAASLSCHKVSTKYIVIIIILCQQSHIRLEGTWDTDITHQLVHGEGISVLRLWPWLDQLCFQISKTALVKTTFVIQEARTMYHSSNHQPLHEKVLEAPLTSQNTFKGFFLIFIPNCAFSPTIKFFPLIQLLQLIFIRKENEIFR